MEALTSVAAEAAADIQRLQVEVLTDGNVRALREAVQTLTKTLAHIERIAGLFCCFLGGGVIVGLFDIPVGERRGMVGAASA